MRAPDAPSLPQIRLHPEAAAVEVQALFRGVVIGTRCLTPEDASAFLIGCAKGVDAPASADLLAGDAHRLVSRDAGGFTVELTQQMRGTVIFEDRTAPLADLLRAHGPQFTPPPAARLQIDCGEVAFLVGTTTRPLEVPRPALARLQDHWPWLVTAAGALLMMLLVAFMPPDMMSLSGELAEGGRNLPPIAFIPPAPPPAPALAHASGAGAPRPVGGGASAPSRRSPPSRRIARPRATAPEDLGREGVLGVLVAYQGKSWAALFSNDDKLQPGSFQGMVDGSGSGVGGTGIGFGGPVGSGAGPGTGPSIGGDPGATIGTCDAACQRRTREALGGPAGLRRHVARALDVIPVDAKVRGTLDREIVRRTIRQHLNEVKYCYERELVRHPALGGRIAVQFTIGPTGSVITSVMQSSTLGNTPVESCIVQAVRRWDFPVQSGGGLTIVSYPFVLVPAGAP
jgi:hypothetical protein